MIFPGNIPTYLAVLLYFIEERIRKPGIKYARHTNKLFRKAHEKKPYINREAQADSENIFIS